MRLRWFPAVLAFMVASCGVPTASVPPAPRASGQLPADWVVLAERMPGTAVALQAATGRARWVAAPKPATRSLGPGVRMLAQPKPGGPLIAYVVPEDPPSAGALERLDPRTHHVLERTHGVRLDVLGAISPHTRWYCGLDLVGGADSYLRCADLQTLRELPPLDLGRMNVLMPFTPYAFLWAPDGRAFLVVNAEAGWVERFDVPHLRLAARVQLPGSVAALWGAAIAEAKGEMDRVDPSAAISPDGRTVFVIGHGYGLWVIRVRDLHVLHHSLPGVRFQSLAVSPGGGVVYALASNFLSVLSAADGHELRRVTDLHDGCCRILTVRK